MEKAMSVDWSLAAPQWDRRRGDVETMKAELTSRLIAGLGPLGGKRVLELGAGTGELAARLAEEVGPAGSVLASDAAPGMVELLEKRLAAVPNAEVATLDAGSIDRSAASFDVVVFRMGLMLIEEPDVALAEIRRVLRPGGRAAIAVWGAPQDNPWMITVGMAAMMQGLVQGGPPVGPGGPFSLADPVDLEKRVRGAGFGDVVVNQVASTRLFQTPEEHVDTVLALSPQLAAAVAAAPPEKSAAVREQVAALTAQYRSPDGLELPTSALLCLAW
jgi:SAM-dependent methyltransferase